VSIRQRQPVRVTAPPITQEHRLREWMLEVTDALNTLPPMSTFSYVTPEGNVDAIPSTIGHNLRDGSVWVKHSGDTSVGWFEIELGGDPAEATHDSVVYGGMFAEDNAVLISSVNSVGQPVAGIYHDTMPTHNATVNLTNGTIQVSQSGIYEVHGAFSVGASLNNQEVAIYCYNNNKTTEIGNHVKLGTANDTGTVSFTGLLSCDTNDTLLGWVYRETGAGTPNIDIEDAQFWVRRIDDLG